MIRKIRLKSLNLTILLLAFLFCFAFDCVHAADDRLQETALIYDDEFDDPENFSFGENTTSVKKVNDPLEKVNRKVFAFNEFVDINLFDPVVKAYRRAVPRIIRQPLGNFLNNLQMPLVVVNSILQGNAENSMASFSTFLINTTIGVGGIFDVAGAKKIEFNNEDFGQTFAKYGIPQGPYLVIPLLGPSTVRDFGGYGVEKAFDPFAFNVLHLGGKEKIIPNAFSISVAALSALNTREGLIDILDSARKDSFDLYATIRSAYIQRRDFEISK